MIHFGAAVVEERGQFADLVHVDVRGGRDRMNSETGIALLQFRERVVRLHGFVESPGRTPEFIMEFSQTVERNLGDKEIKFGFLQRLGYLLYGSIREVAVGGDVNLAHLVVLDELAAYFAEFRAQKGFASGQIQGLDASEGT